MQDLESAAPRGSPQRRLTASKGEVELAVIRDFALWQHAQRSMQFDKSSDDPQPRRIRLKDFAEYYFRSLSKYYTDCFPVQQATQTRTATGTRVTCRMIYKFAPDADRVCPCAVVVRTFRATAGHAGAVGILMLPLHL